MTPLLLIVTVLIGLSGCAAPVVIASAAVPAVQAGTEAFVRGDLESAQIATMEAIYAATEHALTDLEFRIVTKKMGKNAAYIRAKELGGRAVTVDTPSRQHHNPTAGKEEGLETN